MSLLLARKQDHALIRERLRRKGIECEIKNLYSSYNFKAAMNAAVLYHDMRFDKLLDAMAYNKEFSFNGKFAKVIYVTQFLKLPNQSTKNLLSKEDLRVLEEWVKKEHENETLKFWSYQNDESTNEYYI